MARLHEYQGKELLKRFKLAVPRGGVARTPEEARQIAEEIGGEAMVKMQAWVTGRAGLGGIKKASNPAQAEEAARHMLGQRIKNFTVEQVLVEERVEIAREFYAGVIIDDAAQQPIILFSSVGGTGIEEIAAAHPDKVARMHVDVGTGLLDFQARDLVRRTGIGGKLQVDLGNVLVSLYNLAQQYDARAAEINPLVQLSDGTLMAADCRVTVDDYGIFRHKDLGIEIAREYDRPPTELEKIAYKVEANDYRGTFYFIQMAEGFEKGEGYVGFHGAGGGGSMMSMDAIMRQGYKMATFVDTSGNPAASKVYRAARIVMAAGPIDGYFGSGSGVASQEQFHSARGFVKAFLETQIDVPVVIRLGGNSEDKAVEILEWLNGWVPAPVEGYKKDNPPDHCAARLHALIQEGKRVEPQKRERPGAAGEARLYQFETVTGGTVTYDHAVCATCETKACIQECVPKILTCNEEGLPVLNITAEEARKGRCIECLACEVDCFFRGAGGGHIVLPIPGLDEYLAA
ncbi:MAG: acetate--CoA ligase family protein [Anaerolineae bacterium]|jgi:succinyl-CoA synthetase beta subunit|nr:acetate--CoA ligase family protein [Anaerolineae bacterium]MDX9831818.1 acetate--CoA ligase family protein [Anaerolineae bacterium]